MKSPKHVFAIVTNMNAFQDIVHLVENMTIYSIWTIYTICQLHSASMATMFSSWKWNAQCSSCYVRTKHNLFVMLVVFRISFLGGFWVVNLLLSCQDRIFPPHVFSVFFFPVVIICVVPVNILVHVYLWFFVSTKNSMPDLHGTRWYTFANGFDAMVIAACWAFAHSNFSHLEYLCDYMGLYPTVKLGQGAKPGYCGAKTNNQSGLLSNNITVVALSNWQL